MYNYKISRPLSYNPSHLDLLIIYTKLKDKGTYFSLGRSEGRELDLLIKRLVNLKTLLGI